MKRLLLQLVTCAVVATATQAQSATVLKKVMELKMPKTAADDMPGTRGASVAWHPVQKKYYAVFAGNTAYPMAVFNNKGNRLSSDSQRALIDSRGLWYDPAGKQISGNGYNDNGWFNYELDGKGMLLDVEVTADGMNQPGEQCVGAYNATAEEVLFLFGSQVHVYNSDAEPEDPITIHWSRKKSDGPADDEDIDETPEDYNYTTVIYTGIKGQELGFLNITNKQIELYDIKTGYLSKTLSLPETATTEASFNFAYTNGIYWLFNMDLRKWIGYK